MSAFRCKRRGAPTPRRKMIVKISWLLSLTWFLSWGCYTTPLQPPPAAPIQPLQPPPAAPTQPLPQSTVYEANDKEPAEHNAFRLFHREQFDNLILTACVEHGLDPFLLKGLLLTESGLKPKRVNGETRAAGIAQFTAGGRIAITEIRKIRGMPPRKAKFTRKQAFDPAHAIPAAAEFLRHLIEKYGRDGGLAAYNGGPRAGEVVAKYGLRRAGGQTRTFILRVHRFTNKLRTELGLPPLPPPAWRWQMQKRETLTVGLLATQDIARK